MSFTPAKQSSFVRILLFLRKRLLSFTYMENLYPYNISKTLKLQRFICLSDNRVDKFINSVAAPKNMLKSSAKL